MAFVLFVVTLLLYGLTRTQVNTFDAVSYANQIAHLYPRTGDRHWLFHPHHLLFNALGYALWRAAQFFGYGGGPLVVLQSLNCVLGAGGVALFYLTLRRLMHRSRWLPLLVSLSLALSFGYWICATDGRVNMPSIALLLAALYALVGLMENPSPRRAALTGALAAAAVLFHESAGLFLFVGLAGTLLSPSDPMTLPDAKRRARAKTLAAYAGPWAAVVIVPYLLVGTLGLGLHSVAAFRHWSETYSELGWWWDFRVGHNLRLDAYALRHAAFVEPPGKQGTFYVSHAVPEALRALYFATLAGWLVAAYAFCVALPLLWRAHHRAVSVVCLLWIALYAAFFTVWSPGYFVFWVPVLAPISLLLALVLAQRRAGRAGLLVNWTLGLWIALSAALNVQASIAPHCRPNASPFRRAAEDIRAHTQPGDLVLVAGAGDGADLEVNVPYFADRDVLSLHTTLTRAREDKTRALAVGQAQMAQTLASGHAVYALDELWHNRRTWIALQQRHPEWGRADLQTLCAPYRRALAWTGPRGPVWRLTPIAAPPAP